MGDGMLIVCGQRKFSAQLLTILSSEIAGSHTMASTGAEARRKTGMSEFSAVLIAGKVPDEDGFSLAADLASNGICVMIVVDRTALFEAHELFDGMGVTILANPLTKDSLIQAIRLIVKVREGGGGTLEKAKLRLVQSHGWTEPQAHRYIQKISMDKRIPRDVAAQLVLRALDREKSK